MQEEAGTPLTSSHPAQSAPRPVPPGHQRRLTTVLLGLALVVLVIDQGTKVWALNSLTPGEKVDLIGSFISLNLIRNPGAAFGMGAGATIVFSIFAIVATLACLFYALPRITRPWHGVVLGMLMAGITGNLVDRIFQPPAALHGHVVDMFQLPNFAIFNVADMCITFAAAIIIINSFRGDPDKDEAEGAGETAP